MKMSFPKHAGVLCSVLSLLLSSACNAATITNTYETSKTIIVI